MLATTGLLAGRRVLTASRGIGSYVRGIALKSANDRVVVVSKIVALSPKLSASSHSLNLSVRWFSSDDKKPEFDEIGGIMKKIGGIISPEDVKSTNAIFQFDIKDTGKWYMDLKSGSGTVGSGDSPEKSDVTLSMASPDFIKMFSGKLSPTSAYMTGKLKMKGDITKAMALDKLMGKIKGKL